MKQYFSGRSRKCYEQDISPDAIVLINDKPEKWEDKLFLDVFRQQRRYLDLLLNNISLDSELAKYVLLLKTEENPAQHLMKMLDRIIDCGWDSFSSSVELFFDARGSGIPGDVEKIIEVARRFYDYYIFYLEMLYDIEFLYLLDGEKIRDWFKDAIKIILEEVCFVMLDRIDLLVTKIVNGDEIEKDILHFNHKIDLDINLINKEMIEFMVKSYGGRMKTMHTIPFENVKGIKENMVLITLEEYLKLKNK